MPGFVAAFRVCVALGTLVLAACGGLAAGPKSPLPDIDEVIEGKSGMPGSGLAASYSAAEVKACLAYSLRTNEARDCRDRIVQALVTAVNLRYAEFELGFFDAYRYGNFGGALAVLGLGTAGALSGGGAAQVLSGLSAAVTGTRAAFSREVLQEQTSAALLTAMRAQRNQADLRIRAGLRMTAVEYPLGVALSDVYALFRAGTLPGALSGVTQAVGVQGQIQQDALARDTQAEPTSIVLPPPAAFPPAAVGSLRRPPNASALALAPSSIPVPAAAPAPAPAPAPALAPTRRPAQPFAAAEVPVANVLRSFVDGAGLPPAEKTARRQRLRLAAALEGVPDVNIAQFLFDPSAEAALLQERVARRLGLIP